MISNWLEQAVEIGSLLYGEAIQYDNYCTWIGRASIQFKSRSIAGLQTFGGNLYGGTAGMALFFAKLAEFSEDAIFREMALGALEHALHMQTHTSSLGYFSGTAGIAITAIRLGHLFDLPRLIRRGVDMLQDIRTTLNTSTEFDVISGRAGIILALYQLHSEWCCEDWLRNWMFEMANDLSEMQINTDRGGTWIRPNADSPLGLTGFSHGVAGIISALAATSQLLGDGHWMKAIGLGLKYEQSWFDTERGNWADLRRSKQAQPGYMNAWCHGAPGIAISRVFLNYILPDQDLDLQALTALETTQQSLTRMNNHSLCHGLLGNIELLVSLGGVLNAPHLVDVGLRRAATTLDAICSQGHSFISGTIDLDYSPDLMMGLAGVGYFFLRMHAPTRVPSLLTFGLENSCE